jgi:hypothetical protein
MSFDTVPRKGHEKQVLILAQPHGLCREPGTYGIPGFGLQIRVRSTSSWSPEDRVQKRGSTTVDFRDGDRVGECRSPVGLQRPFRPGRCDYHSYPPVLENTSSGPVTSST